MGGRSVSEVYRCIGESLSQIVDSERNCTVAADVTGLGGTDDLSNAYTYVLYGTWDLTHV